MNARTILLLCVSGGAACSASAPPRPVAPAVPELTPIADLACARDPRADAAVRWWDPFERGPAAPLDFSFEPLPDLDGDGIEDQAVLSESKGCAGMAGNCVNLVYLSRRGCEYAGSFYGAAHTVEALPQAHGGVRDLRVLGQSRCAGRGGDLLRLRWDGTEYRQIECPQSESDLRP